MGSIRGIPTTYKGRRYRSRLEARWAAFFDFIEWEHEYEPLDLDGWIPDFALRANNDHGLILVEIKPIMAVDEAVTSKIDKAITASGIDYEAILLGVRPFHQSESFQWPCLGWIGEQAAPDGEPSCVWWQDAPFGEHGRSDIFDFFADYGQYRYRLSGVYEGDGHLSPPDVAYLKSLWAKAGNVVQWRAPV